MFLHRWRNLVGQSILLWSSGLTTFVYLLFTSTINSDFFSRRSSSWRKNTWGILHSTSLFSISNPRTGVWGETEHLTLTDDWVVVHSVTTFTKEKIKKREKERKFPYSRRKCGPIDSHSLWSFFSIVRMTRVWTTIRP